MLTCEESSNKVLPSQTQNGYSFMVEQGEEIKITFSLKNYTNSNFGFVTKNVVDLMDVVMFNNVIWDPIILYTIKLKRKDDILHNVVI